VASTLKGEAGMRAGRAALSRVQSMYWCDGRCSFLFLRRPRRSIRAL